MLKSEMKCISLCLDVAVRTMRKFMGVSLDAYAYWAPLE